MKALHFIFQHRQRMVKKSLLKLKTYNIKKKNTKNTVRVGEMFLRALTEYNSQASIFGGVIPEFQFDDAALKGQKPCCLRQASGKKS